MRLLLLLLPLNVWAAPFVVTGPVDPRVTTCGWWFDSSAKVELPVAPDGLGNNICKFDLNGRTGAHAARATAIAIDPAAGRLESASSPIFHFTITPPAVPGSFAVVPN